MQATAIIANPDQRAREAQSRAFEQAGFPVHSVTSAMEAVHAALNLRPQIIVCDCGGQAPSPDELCYRVRNHPATANAIIIVILPRDDVDVRLRAFAAGADDCQVRGVDPRELVARAMALLNRWRRGKITESPRDGRVISLFSAKGGVGTTTLCVNLGASLAGLREESVALVDLGLPFGTANRLIGLEPSANVSQLTSEQSGGINRSSLELLLATRPGLGFELLPGVRDPREAQTLEADQVTAVIRQLRAMYAYTLVDLGSAPASLGPAVMASSDHLVMVVTPDPVCVAVSKGYLDYLREAGLRGDRLSIALSLAGSRGSLTRLDVEGQLRYPVCVLVPHDSDGLAAAASAGIPLVHRDPYCSISIQLRAMAEWLLQDNSAAPAPRTPHLQPAAATFGVGVLPGPLAARAYGVA